MSMVGTFCISIDLEMGWGIWDKPDDDYFERCVTREHAIVHRLLRIFEQHGVCATWAIVGRLLELDDAQARTTRHGAHLWFAPELVEAVRAANVPQDIGSHSYAHPYFGESTEDALRQDLAAARSAHDRHGLSFSSFVFPRNQVAHTDLLREFGVRVYRSVDQGWHVELRDRLGGRAGRVAHLANAVVPLAPTTVAPRQDNKLVELPSSMLFMGRKGVRRWIPARALVSKANRGLVAAADRSECFHLWLHPSNFYHRTEEQLVAFEAVIEAASRLRASGRLAIRSMQDYAAV